MQYYAPGQSAARPPAWDKTVYITNNAAGRRLVFEFTHSLVEHIAAMWFAEHVEVTLTAHSKDDQSVIDAKEEIVSENN